MGQRVCSADSRWALALNLKFERLISIDLILYGSSLLLEFVALIVLRIREPNLPRPFKAGNLAFACVSGDRPGRAYRLRAVCFARRRDLLAHNSVSSLRLLRRGRSARSGSLLAYCRPVCTPTPGSRLRTD